jgi:cytochrome c peroxidase
MRWHCSTQLIVGVWLAGTALLAVELQAIRGNQGEPIVPVPRSIAADSTRASLGGRLFHDLRLSRHKSHSCATCHPLDRGGMDGLQMALRPGDGQSLRNTPTIFNVSLNASFNWDGQTSTLEDHTRTVVQNVMGLRWPDLLARLRSDPSYEKTFAGSYDDGLTELNVINAIASFERTLITADAPFDRFLRGDEALSETAKDGYRRFRAYGCASCHQGVNVGGNLFQRFGIFDAPSGRAGRPLDPGRFRVTLVPRDMEVFRVPSLRNVVATAPYFHDGRAATLEEAVEIMGQRQLGRTLDTEDTRLIVAFLESLTGQYDGRPVSPPSMTPSHDTPQR